MTRATHETDADKLRRRNRELSILNTIAAALNGEVDLSQALQTALAQVAALLDLRTGWVWLLREETGDSYLAAAQNLPPALANKPQRMEGTCYCLDTYRAGDLDGAANVNVVGCSRLKWLAQGTEGLRYHASIPLYAHGKQLGVMNVASPDWRELSPDDLRLLYTVGDLLSIAIERARLFDRSAQLGATEERNRLAREIHDTLAQGLAAITLQLETADALLEAGAAVEKTQQVVKRALEQARNNLDAARRSVLDLRAAPLEGRSLREAVEALVATHDTLHIETIFTGDNHPLPARVEIGVYRMVEEALNNAARHAGADRAQLKLMITPDQVKLVIVDDGRGFDPSEIPDGHFGLVGMNERAKLLGGALELRSAPGMGTRFDIRIPLDW